MEYKLRVPGRLRVVAWVLGAFILGIGPLVPSRRQAGKNWFFPDEVGNVAIRRHFYAPHGFVCAGCFIL